MHRIVASFAATRRLGAARDWLIERREQEVLIVAKTRSAADDLVRSAARKSGGLFGAHRASPGQLAADLATVPMARAGLAPVSDLAVVALAARTIHSTHADQPLSYFAPVVDAPGFPRALVRTLTELRRQRITPDRLETSGVAGSDLARLLECYQRELKRRHLADDARSRELATGVVDEGRHTLVGRPLLLLDLAPASASEIELIRALAARSSDALATVISGDDQARTQLEEILGAEASDLDRDENTSAKLVRLRRNVFAEVTADDVQDSTDDTSLEFITAPGEGSECIEIARRVLGLARDGIALDGIAVLLRDPSAYQPLLEDAFGRAAIPAYFSRGTARPDPAGRAFLALLRCAADNLSATRFVEYVSLGQVPKVDDHGAPAAREVPWVEPRGDQLVFKTFEKEEPASDPDATDDDESEDAPVASGTLKAPYHWEKLLVDAAVVGGHERWQRRLRGKIREFERQLTALDDTDDENRERVRRTIERLHNLTLFALPVIEALARLPERAPWGEWRQLLEQLANLTLRHRHSVLRVLSELRPMDDVGPVTIDEVADVLSERLTVLQEEPPRRRFGRVFVATIDQARGRSFEYVFVPGLAEGIFPRKAFEDPLLLDQARAALDRALPTQKRRNEEERLLLRVAIGCAGSGLVLSYPSMDTMQGRARVPSFYALDVIRAAEGSLPDLRELEKRARASASGRLGWPAPTSSELAIDDAEYDLAVLAPLLESGTESEARDLSGRARYLLTANEHLSRSLRTRWARWDKRWSMADGLVDPDAATLASLRDQRPTVRSFSPTALQNYATCPYKFLLYALHRLRTREEIVEIQQLDPLSRGSMFHEVLAELMRKLEKLDLLPITDARLEAAFAEAETTLAEVSTRWHDDLAPAIERVWESEIESLGADLRGFLRTVAHSGEEAWRPAYFELGFGLENDPGRDQHSQDQPARVLDGYLLRGSIDLVEANDETGQLRVTDYKTGKAPWEKYLVIGHGEILQPVLYALAAEQQLSKKVHSGRLFYCTQRGEFQTRDVKWDESSRAIASDVLTTVASAIEVGFLPAAPRERGCDYCDYRAVCGPYEQIRFEQKRHKDPRLERLLRLRKQG